VSIAYERRGRVELALVFDALKRELFVARPWCAAQRMADPRERDAVARPRATWPPPFPTTKVSGAVSI
jgi:hypothetical protein